MNRILIAILLSFWILTGNSQNSWDRKSLTIENENLIRKIVFEKDVQGELFEVTEYTE